jgi:uncharacterized membrane protein
MADPRTRLPAAAIPFELSTWQSVSLVSLASFTRRHYIAVPLSLSVWKLLTSRSFGSYPEAHMTTRVTVANHPLHPMLVTLPIGLWVFSLVCDIIFASTGDSRWDTTAYFTLGGGIVGALLAAVPGLLDFLGLQDAREKRVGITHLILNLSLVALQVFNFWLRAQANTNVRLPMLISVVAVAVLVVSGWLGGQLVHVFGVTQPHHGEAAAPGHDHLHPRT